MRMSIALDERLLKEAQSLSGKRTKREVIDEALSEFIRKKRRDEAIKHAGKVKIDITIEELQRLREDR